MPFYEYMVQHYAEEKSAKGAIARKMRALITEGFGLVRLIDSLASLAIWLYPDEPPYEEEHPITEDILRLVWKEYTKSCGWR